MTKKEILNLSDNELDRVVKIQGTRFDRKRKVNPQMAEKISYLKACGLTNATIAENVGVSSTTVRYYTDDRFRYNVCHVGGTHAKGNRTLEDRAQYKRNLVSVGANVIYPRG